MLRMLSSGRSIGLGVLFVTIAALAMACSSPAASTPASKSSGDAARSSTSADAGKTITLKMTSWPGATHPITIMQERWKELVEQRSAGRIKIEYYAGEALVKTPDTFEAVRDNVVQVAETSTALEPGAFPFLLNIPGLPWNYTAERFGANWRKPGGFHDFVQPEFEKLGMRLVSWPVTPANVIFGSKPIVKLEDFKGKLIRGAPGGTEEALKLWGATPTMIPGGDLYTALQRGTIDSVVISLLTYTSQKLYEVAPHLTICDISQASLQIVVNKQVYDGLPADLKKIFDDAWLEVEKRHFAEAQKAYEDAIAESKSKPNVKVYMVPAEEQARWREAAKPVYDGLKTKFPKEWAQFEKIWPDLR